MRPTHVILLLALTLLAPGVASAAEPQPQPDREPGYYVRAELHPAERPAERGPEYDCSGRDGPRDLASSVAFTAGQTRVHATQGRAYPPECFVVDGDVVLCAQGLCPKGALPLSLALVEGPRATYNLSSGQYTLFAPNAPTLAGNSGVGVMFDCAHCPPPWAL